MKGQTHSLSLLLGYLPPLSRRHPRLDDTASGMDHRLPPVAVRRNGLSCGNSSTTSRLRRDRNAFGKLSSRATTGANALSLCTYTRLDRVRISTRRARGLFILRMLADACEAVLVASRTRMNVVN